MKGPISSDFEENINFVPSPMHEGGCRGEDEWGGCMGEDA